MDYFLQKKQSGRLYVLMFHKVNDHGHQFYPAVPVSIFEELCRFFAKNFNVITFSETGAYFKRSKRPAVIITFDDNHYDIVENAYPILEKYGLRFNINIATESIETGLPQRNVLIYDILNSTREKEYCNDVVSSRPIKIFIDRSSPLKTSLAFSRALEGLNKEEGRMVMDDIRKKLANSSTVFSRMLSKEDILFLHKRGVEIGSHTHSHPILPSLNMPDIEYELAHSRKILSDICGQNINIVAYPNGRYNETIIKRSLDAGYEYILLTEDRKNTVCDIKNNIFFRANVYYDTVDENLAKVFGVHSIMYRMKSWLKK
jgi:peptidoglycan/xylan/chitin deacetylase (PgdA/CDA1 family)